MTLPLSRLEVAARRADVGEICTHASRLASLVRGLYSCPPPTTDFERELWTRGRGAHVALCETIVGSLRTMPVMVGESGMQFDPSWIIALLEFIIQLLSHATDWRRPAPPADKKTD